MSVFKKYAGFYDLFYADKDYKGEAKAIAANLEKSGNGKIKKVLNLGCGTGRHDHILSEMGYEMTGVDMSEEMVEIANKPSSQPSPLNKGEGANSLSFLKGKGSGIGLKGEGLSFLVGDIRSVKLNQKFDAVISMFHVMSYQTKNEDVLAVFKNVSEHLDTGGVFLFDCWYGPAVLKDRPETRVRKIENGDLKVTRIAQSVLKEDENTVEVSYEFHCFEKKSQKYEIFKEIHNMRYFFIPEIEMIAKYSGFQVIHKISKDWNLEIVMRKG